MCYPERHRKSQADKTDKQLRQNSTPNPWEVAWIMWRYQDDWHHYYFIFKPNGVD
jgi:hypothetical protein